MRTQTRRMALRSLLAASAVTIYVEFPTEAMAGDGCCSNCGCSANRCRKICRLVQEDRKITTTCWGMECEDFCVPGPSTPDCRQCDTVCKSVPGDKVCSQPKRIVWTSQEEGDGAGYDIRSFEPDGTERLLEVKTTNGWERTPFHINRNELEVADLRRESWHLIRLWDFSREPRAFALRPPLARHVELTPTSFMASFDFKG